MSRNYEKMIKEATEIASWLPSYIARKYSVVNDEQFGHTFPRHVSQSIDALTERAKREHCSSTFFSKKSEIIRTMIISSLLNADVIEDIAFWLVDEKVGDILELTIPQPNPIGHGYIDHRHYVSSDLRIVLLRKPERNFYIVTAFPCGSGK